MTEPVDPPPSSGTSAGTSSGTEQQAVMQVVGLGDLKGVLKSVFNEALAQTKVERPTGASTITGGKHTQSSLS